MRDGGERATDATLAACGTTPKLNLRIDEEKRPFPFGGVGGVNGATMTALRAIGPRGQACAKAIWEAQVAEFDKMIGR